MKKVLLLGAGFSYELGMPLASELTQVFLGVFSESFANKLVERLAMNEPFGSDRPVNLEAMKEVMSLVHDYQRQRGNNYEELLANIQNLTKQPGKTLSDTDSYHYMFGVFYSVIHEILNFYQIVTYSKVYPQTFASFRKLAALCAKDETWVFTLNHDMYLECLALDLNIPITYGDVNKVAFPKSNKEMDNLIHFTYSNRDQLGSSKHQMFFEKERGINLVKLHGGLSELEYKDGSQLLNQSLSLSHSVELMKNFTNIQNMCYYKGDFRIPSSKDKVVSNLDGELDILVQSMLTGGSKYSLTTNEKQGEEKLKLLVDNISNASELVIIGYGFGDKHINYRLSNAMVLNQNLKITIVDPINKPIPEILEQFNYDRRVKVVTCGAPQWLEYFENETWNAEVTEFLDKSKGLRQAVFEEVKATYCRPTT
ncbi:MULTISPECIES: hypothetical protein [Vibrio]|uniref:hypothetical protein n=1 Tax=Vibrio TaxID=662 RepID=UPI001F3443F9|nr:hypothetical protein [Vibrio sp. McD22-P3]MCF4172729.1 hypothetical protein [Vibrio sp. McD22-P3]